MLQHYHIYKTLLVGACVAAFPVSAFAASPIGNVGTAKVDEGVLNVEVRSGYTLDDDSRSTNQRFQTRQHIDYGLNDWYAARLVVSQDNRNGDNMEHGSLSFENRIQLFEKKDHGFDGGIRLIYGHRDGDKTPHEIDFRIMAMGDIDEKWSYRHNTVLERDIGENETSGIALEFRNQIMYQLEQPEYLKKLLVGAEMFNDFGKLNQQMGLVNHDHQIGPVVKAYFHNGSYLQTGYRKGLTRGSADHLFKLFVGHNF